MRGSNGPMSPIGNEKTKKIFYVSCANQWLCIDETKQTDRRQLKTEIVARGLKKDEPELPRLIRSTPLFTINTGHRAEKDKTERKVS